MQLRRWSALGAFAALGVLLLTVPTAGFGGEDESSGATLKHGAGSGVYIVRMVDQPVVAYEGGIAGLKATKPAKGTKIDPRSSDVAKYAGYLDSKHDAALAKVGGKKVYDYRYTYNGFAAQLSEAQADKLAATEGVLSVEKAVEVTMDTATTPTFLGLTDPANGLWTKQGIKGENVVIGIIDSGVWPENPAFSDRDANGKLIYSPNPGIWHGRKCNPGEAWDASLCNQKLIGAQYFCASRGCDSVLPHEFLSPRDYNGHGTHTASTAGGNEAVPTTGAAALFGTINGIAPRARIATYKVCYDNGEGGCGANTGDSVAAIDQAVADGVDVLNYSISGTSTNYLDAVEVAYLFAADAGVFVATSAGNSGPTASTVAHISPWLASVAAGTHNRSGTAVATLGNGATFTGASLTAAVGSSPLVRAQDAGVAGADPNLLRQCFSDPVVLDPAKVAGKIVLCERGGAAPANARVDKSAAVKVAGGVGMILANVTASSLNADLHSIPTVHVDHVAWPTIAAYAQTAGATASLSQAVVNDTAPAPDVASFSSRGPSLAGGGDILKPDFMAPGQDILAAVAPPGNAGKDFDLYSGTSMSSPHVAGLGALLTEAHPDWSPAAMRSALATTADAVSRSSLTAPFGAGSGHVRPNLSTDPGLVYDAGFADYLSFLKGQRLIGNNVPAIDASDLNQPSIAIGDLAGAQTVTRTVTNVASTAATYTAALVLPAGFTGSVSPSSFTIAPGAKQTYTVSFTRTDAPFNTFRFGSLTWSDGTHSVRSPIALRPVQIAAPAELSGTGTSGAFDYTVKPGYTGTLTAAAAGLVPATTTAGTVPDDPTDEFVKDGPGQVKFDVAIPAGTTYARWNLFDAHTDGDDDLDLYVYRGATLVGASGGGTSAEQVSLVNPPADTYSVYVHGWQTDGPDAQFTLFGWALGSTATSLTASPASQPATTGQPAPMSAAWTGLTAGTKYLGSVTYGDGTNAVGRTIVRVDG